MSAESRGWAVPSRRRTALLNVGFGYAGVLLVLAQGFVLTPVYLRHIPVELFGAWIATGNVLAWLELVDPGLATLLQQRVAVAFGREDPQELGKVIGSGLLVAGLFSALPLAALPLAGRIVSIVNLHGAFGDELVRAFRLGLVNLSLTLATHGLVGVNVGLQRATVAGTTSLAGTIVGIAASLTLIAAGFGLIAIPGGFIARALFMLVANGLALLSWTRRHLPGVMVVRGQEARALFHLSTWGVVGRAGATLLQRVDGFLGARLVSPSAAAVLTLSGRSFDVVRMATDRIASGLSAPLAHLAGGGPSARLGDIVERLLAVTSWISGVGLAVVIALNEAFVRLWVGDALFGGEALTVAIAASTAVAIQVTLFAQLVYGLGGVRACSIIVLAEAGAKLPLQILLGKEYGLIGLPVAGALTGLVVSFVLLPLAAADLVGVKRPQLLRKALQRLGCVALVAACGVPLRWLVHQVGIDWSWPRLVLAGLAAGLVAGGMLYGADHAARAEVRNAWRWMSDGISVWMRRGRAGGGK